MNKDTLVQIKVQSKPYHLPLPFLKSYNIFTFQTAFYLTLFQSQHSPVSKKASEEVKRFVQDHKAA